MPSIPDQKPVWDSKHAAGVHEKLRHQPSPLGELAEQYFADGSQILELGCGVGRDAEYFTKCGHSVIATDSSEVVIEQDRHHFADTGIKFEVLDMRDALPYPDNRFDVVFANLSIHYFSHEDTNRIVKNIQGVLKVGGLLVFACKSVENLELGNGEEVEEDVFVSDSGHVRHLFSEPYTRTLLNGLFQIEYLDVIDEDYNGEESSILRCVAKSTERS
ncbi:MAG TPA: class I SAM-dependent methyltransferase [Candidatus Saccharimonadales bacterium]|jgi:SAM-dependent methyltransferase